MKQGTVALFVPHAGCPHRCSFCDQRTLSGETALPTPQDVADACRRALAQQSGRRLELGFFGGSFTAIDRGTMTALLAAAQPFLGGDRLCGIRVSTRPDAVDDAALETLARFGVTAIELGAQSMDDAVLAQNGRGHTAQQTRDASARIRAHGFSLGLQMMVGLDGEAPDGAEHTARELIALSPDTVRIYPVLVLRGTELERRMLSGDYRPPTLDGAVDTTARVMELFERSGIRIIRVGLHDSPALAPQVAAGPYHPAFRELCDGKIMLSRLLPQLSGRPAGDVTVRVAPGDTSRMIGQQKRNAGALLRLGYRLRVVEDAAVPPLSPHLVPETEDIPCA